MISPGRQGRAALGRLLQGHRDGLGGSSYKLSARARGLEGLRSRAGLSIGATWSARGQHRGMCGISHQPVARQGKSSPLAHGLPGPEPVACPLAGSLGTSPRARQRRRGEAGAHLRAREAACPQPWPNTAPGLWARPEPRGGLRLPVRHKSPSPAESLTLRASWASSAKRQAASGSLSNMREFE